MSGGKGGQTTTQVQIPPYLEAASKANLAQARDISRIGFVPYYGPDIAAFDPSQIQAMQAAQDQAAAFGLAPSMDVMSTIPQAQNFGGMMAYSSAPLYEQAVAELQSRRPAQYQQIVKNFVDPNPAPAPVVTRPTRPVNIISTPMNYGGYDLGPDIEEALRMADEANYAPQVAVAPMPAPMAPTSVVAPARPRTNYSDYFGY